MRHKFIRLSILAVSIILFSFFAMRHFILGGAVAGSVDALCPFGGFETLYTFIASGGFVPRVLMSSLILAIGVSLTALILKRGFCGYICPFGAVQEFAGMLKKKKIKVMKRLDSHGRYLKYIILVLILVTTAITGTLTFREYDPFLTFFHFGKGILWDYNADEFSEHLFGFVIAISVVIGTVFISRIWCRYLCPLGATLSIFSKFGFSSINRSKKKCIDCKKCDKECPVDITVSSTKRVKTAECLNCNRCIDVCPKDALCINLFGKRMSMNTYAFLTIAIFFLVVLIAKLTGLWVSVPQAGISTDVGLFDPGLIKGWMTLEQISIDTGIPVQTFIDDLGLPSDLDPKTPLKDIGKTYEIEFDTESLREYLRTGTSTIENKILT